MTDGPRYYAKDGEPIGLPEWGRLYDDEAYRRVGLDVIGDVTVSTVWLGLNLSLYIDGPPVIFETMVFGGALDESTWRYATEEEARHGHADAVRLVRITGTVEPEPEP